jgi:hypothetical protein
MAIYRFLGCPQPGHAMGLEGSRLSIFDAITLHEMKGACGKILSANLDQGGFPESEARFRLKGYRSGRGPDKVVSYAF